MTVYWELQTMRVSPKLQRSLSGPLEEQGEIQTGGALDNLEGHDLVKTTSSMFECFDV
jgi:hypothetical protein